MKNYQVLIDPATFEKVGSYLNQIKSGITPGRCLFDRIKHLDLDRIITIESIDLLVRTKRPQILQKLPKPKSAIEELSADREYSDANTRGRAKCLERIQINLFA